MAPSGLLGLAFYSFFSATFGPSVATTWLGSIEPRSGDALVGHGFSHGFGRQMIIKVPAARRLLGYANGGR